MMWAITPTYAVIIAFMSWIVLCWIRIWSSTPRRGRSSSICAVPSLILHRLFLVLFAFLGIYLLDIVARLCFLDLISYGSFSRVAAPVIVCMTLGVVYVIGCVFISPTWSTLAAFGGMAGVYLYMSVIAPLPQLRVALFAGIGLTVVLGLIDALCSLRKPGQLSKQINSRADRGDETPNVHEEEARRRAVLSPPIWDFSHGFGRMTGPWAYIIVLVLVSVELVLQFEGLSLLCWL